MTVAQLFRLIYNQKACRLMVGLAVLLCGLAFGVTVTAPAAFAGSDTYPAKWADAPQDSPSDSWGELNRECTSYVAWMLHSVNGFEMPFHANATVWGPDTASRGFTVSSQPALGSVYWTTPGKGHVAWVESVNPGGTVTIEDYNSDYTGHWAEHTVQPVQRRDISTLRTSSLPPRLHLNLTFFWQCLEPRFTPRSTSVTSGPRKPAPQPTLRPPQPDRHYRHQREPRGQGRPERSVVHRDRRRGPVCRHA